MSDKLKTLTECDLLFSICRDIEPSLKLLHPAFLCQEQGGHASEQELAHRDHADPVRGRLAARVFVRALEDQPEGLADGGAASSAWQFLDRTVLRTLALRHGGRVAFSGLCDLFLEFSCATAGVHYASDIYRAVEQEPDDDNRIQLQVSIGIDDVTDALIGLDSMQHNAECPAALRS